MSKYTELINENQNIVIGIILAIVILSAGGYYYQTNGVVSIESIDTEKDSIQEGTNGTVLVQVTCNRISCNYEEITISSGDKETIIEKDGKLSGSKIIRKNITVSDSIITASTTGSEKSASVSIFNQDIPDIASVDFPDEVRVNETYIGKITVRCNADKCKSSKISLDSETRKVPQLSLGETHSVEYVRTREESGTITARLGSDKRDIEINVIQDTDKLTISQIKKPESVIVNNNYTVDIIAKCNSNKCSKETLNLNGNSKTVPQLSNQQTKKLTYTLQSQTPQEKQFNIKNRKFNITILDRPELIGINTDSKIPSGQPVEIEAIINCPTFKCTSSKLIFKGDIQTKEQQIPVTKGKTKETIIITKQDEKTYNITVQHNNESESESFTIINNNGSYISSLETPENIQTGSLFSIEATIKCDIQKCQESTLYIKTSDDLIQKTQINELLSGESITKTVFYNPTEAGNLEIRADLNNQQKTNIVTVNNGEIRVKSVTARQTGGQINVTTTVRCEASICPAQPLEISELSTVAASQYTIQATQDNSKTVQIPRLRQGEEREINTLFNREEIGTYEFAASVGSIQEGVDKTDTVEFENVAEIQSIEFIPNNEPLSTVKIAKEQDLQIAVTLTCQNFTNCDTDTLLSVNGQSQPVPPVGDSRVITFNINDLELGENTINIKYDNQEKSRIVTVLSESDSKVISSISATKQNNTITTETTINCLVEVCRAQQLNIAEIGNISQSQRILSIQPFEQQTVITTNYTRKQAGQYTFGASFNQVNSSVENTDTITIEQPTSPATITNTTVQPNNDPLDLITINKNRNATITVELTCQAEQCNSQQNLSVSFVEENGTQIKSNSINLKQTKQSDILVKQFSIPIQQADSENIDIIVEYVGQSKKEDINIFSDSTEVLSVSTPEEVQAGEVFEVKTDIVCETEICPPKNLSIGIVDSNQFKTIKSPKLTHFDERTIILKTRRNSTGEFTFGASFDNLTDTGVLTSNVTVKKTTNQAIISDTQISPNNSPLFDVSLTKGREANIDIELLCTADECNSNSTLSVLNKSIQVDSLNKSETTTKSVNFTLNESQTLDITYGNDSRQQFIGVIPDNESTLITNITLPNNPVETGEQFNVNTTIRCQVEICESQKLNIAEIGNISQSNRNVQTPEILGDESRIVISEQYVRNTSGEYTFGASLKQVNSSVDNKDTVNVTSSQSTGTASITNTSITPNNNPVETVTLTKQRNASITVELTCEFDSCNTNNTLEVLNQTQEIKQLNKSETVTETFNFTANNNRTITVDYGSDSTQRTITVISDENSTVITNLSVPDSVGTGQQFEATATVGCNVEICESQDLNIAEIGNETQSLETIQTQTIEGEESTITEVANYVRNQSGNYTFGVSFQQVNNSVENKDTVNVTEAQSTGQASITNTSITPNNNPVETVTITKQRNASITVELTCEFDLCDTNNTLDVFNQTREINSLNKSETVTETFNFTANNNTTITADYEKDSTQRTITVISDENSTVITNLSVPESAETGQQFETNTTVGCNVEICESQELNVAEIGNETQSLKTIQTQTIEGEESTITEIANYVRNQSGNYTFGASFNQVNSSVENKDTVNVTSQGSATVQSMNYESTQQALVRGLPDNSNAPENVPQFNISEKFLATAVITCEFDTCPATSVNFTGDVNETITRNVQQLSKSETVTKSVTINTTTSGVLSMKAAVQPGNGVQKKAEIVSTNGLSKIHSSMSGSGTSSNPYLVTNVSQLQAINHEKDSAYKLANDIQANTTQQQNSGFNPIGSTQNPFNGTLDGDNYSITNLYINRSEEKVGLFGKTKNSQIQNVNLTNTTIVGSTNETGILIGVSEKTQVQNINVNGNITSSGNAGGIIGIATNSVIQNSSSEITIQTTDANAGGLVGIAENNSTITHSTSTGKVSSSFRSGGLVGVTANMVYISQSSSDVKVNGLDDVGGLVGAFNGGSINGSYSKGNVTGRNDLGGLVGNIFSGSVNNSYAKGNVTGNDRVGGLVGTQNSGSINNSYSVSNVTGGTAVGGLVGYGVIGSNTVNNSYAKGNVTGDVTVGGLVGFGGIGSVNNSYSVGNVTGNENVGGTVGRNRFGSIEDVYWDEIASGQSSSGGSSPTGFNTDSDSDGRADEMIGSSASSNMSGFDFTTVWKTVPNEYPRLRNLGGQGKTTTGQATITDTTITPNSEPTSNLTLTENRDAVVEVELTCQFDSCNTSNDITIPLGLQSSTKPVGKLNKSETVVKEVNISIPDKNQLEVIYGEDSEIIEYNVISEQNNTIITDVSGPQSASTSISFSISSTVNCLTEVCKTDSVNFQEIGNITEKTVQTPQLNQNQTQQVSVEFIRDNPDSYTFGASFGFDFTQNQHTIVIE